MESRINSNNNNHRMSNIINYLENLKSEDIKKRVFAVRHFKEISVSMGAQNTKEKIIPFLAGKVKKNLKTMKKKCCWNWLTKWNILQMF
jgi:hypothetical protein